jgi:hypothetical protein
VLGVAFPQVRVTAEARRALPGDGQHRGAEFDAGEGDVCRVVGQIAAYLQA